MTFEPDLRTAGDTLSLARIDGMAGAAEYGILGQTRIPGLDFDENDVVSLSGDQVNLPHPRHSIVIVHNDPAVAQEHTCSVTLGPPAG